MNSTVLAVVLNPAGEAAMMMAFRPLIAIIALFTGVAPGLVEGVMAQTRPIGFAIFDDAELLVFLDDAD